MLSVAPLIDASVNFFLHSLFYVFPLQVVQAFISVGLIVHTCAIHDKIRSMEYYIRYDDNVKWYTQYVRTYVTRIQSVTRSRLVTRNAGVR